MKAYCTQTMSRRRLKQIATNAALGQLKDVETRTKNRMLLAMYNCGLSARTINRVKKEYQRVCNENSKTSMQDGLGDYEVWLALHDRGIETELSKNEI